MKQQKLTEYQEEMRLFTAFLKEKFYFDTTPIEPGEKVIKHMIEAREEAQKQASEPTIGAPEPTRREEDITAHEKEQ